MSGMTDDEVYANLNREFYGSDPTSYFRDRLHLLILRGANPSIIEEHIVDAVWGQLGTIVTPVRSEETAEVAEAKKKAAHQQFLVTESQVLLHHVAEALLRMYLAHESQAECPWLEIAAFKDDRKFREALDELGQRTWTEHRMNAAGWVFLGSVPEDPSGAVDRSARRRRRAAADLGEDRQRGQPALQRRQARCHRAGRHPITALHPGRGRRAAAGVHRRAAAGRDSARRRDDADVP